MINELWGRDDRRINYDKDQRGNGLDKVLNDAT